MRTHVRFPMYLLSFNKHLVHLLVLLYPVDALLPARYRVSSNWYHAVFCYRPGPEVIKLFYMLNLTEHEISTAHNN